MNKGEAIAIFKQLNSDKYTDEEKAIAIYEVMNLETHNSVPKADMHTAIKYLWNKAYYFESEVAE